MFEHQFCLLKPQLWQRSVSSSNYVLRAPHVSLADLSTGLVATSGHLVNKCGSTPKPRPKIFNKLNSQPTDGHFQGLHEFNCLELRFVRQVVVWLMWGSRAQTWD